MTLSTVTAPMTINYLILLIDFILLEYNYTVLNITLNPSLAQWETFNFNSMPRIEVDLE